ncbi:hypothetical protein QCA50_013567 [Cerrena zonata]|uniref:Uncharacterized protein n=1 Tax=Cerrena zonata TaxID=2478898 RepID=A0AAW0G2M2_9APHY
MAYHNNLAEVASTIADLDSELRRIQLSANEVGTAIPAEFHDCHDNFRGIFTTFRQEVVHYAHNTAKFAYNNLLSQVVRDDLSREDKLLKLRRFLEPAPSNVRAANKSASTDNWQRVNTLKLSVRTSETILGHYGFNTTAILNRFDTVLNGIGWFSGVFYPRIEEYAQSWEESILNDTLTDEGLENNVVWLRDVIGKMENF